MMKSDQIWTRFRVKLLLVCNSGVFLHFCCSFGHNNVKRIILDVKAGFVVEDLFLYEAQSLLLHFLSAGRLFNVL